MAVGRDIAIKYRDRDWSFKAEIKEADINMARASQDCGNSVLPAPCASAAPCCAGGRLHLAPHRGFHRAGSRSDATQSVSRKTRTTR